MGPTGQHVCPKHHAKLHVVFTLKQILIGHLGIIEPVITGRAHVLPALGAVYVL